MNDIIVISPIPKSLTDSGTRSIWSMINEEISRVTVAILQNSSINSFVNFDDNNDDVNIVDDVSDCDEVDHDCISCDMCFDIGTMKSMAPAAHATVPPVKSISLLNELGNELTEEVVVVEVVVVEEAEIGKVEIGLDGAVPIVEVVVETGDVPYGRKSTDNKNRNFISLISFIC